MEYVDIYTLQRRRTGRTAPRGQKLAEGEYRVVVHAVLFNSRGELLIQQRQPFKQGWSGLWDFTVGGAVTAGETSGEAVVRELEEELGLQWALGDTPPVLTVSFDHGFNDIYLLRGDVDLSALTLQYEEVAQVKWASREEVWRMLKEETFVPYHKGLVDLLFDMTAQPGGLRIV